MGALYIVFLVYSIIYLVGSFYVTILKLETIFNKKLMIFGAICYFLLIILAGITIIDNDKYKKQQKSEKYELVNERFYKKVK